MSPQEQESSPFRSPHQQALASATLMDSMGYPSPARSDCGSSRYTVDGLGLYNYSPHFTSTAQPASTMFAPSPHSTESWTSISSGPSPLVSSCIVDPWTSGAYDHPVLQSPGPWPRYEASHCSSTSSPRGMSVFSGDGSDVGFPRVKIEAGSEWASDEDNTSIRAIAPAQLMNHNPLTYSHAPPSSPMPMYDNGLAIGYSGHAAKLEHFHSASVEEGAPARPRDRRRRAKPSPDAKFLCEVCGHSFIRSYNKKTHMQRHNPNREKEHRCHHGECILRFERKTDLDRHIKSVHNKIKDMECRRCGQAFSRKDTLRRHEDDGCHKRTHIGRTNALARHGTSRSLTSASQIALSSLRPEGYRTAEEGYTSHSAEGAGSYFDAKLPTGVETNDYDIRPMPSFRDRPTGQFLALLDEEAKPRMD